ncbi:MAG: flagellar basal body M-ring protein FliF, partial [Undibacterium sp.]|nr:flagellar basal body M-ring protein FliF [Undibacterium sp.]
KKEKQEEKERKAAEALEAAEEEAAIVSLSEAAEAQAQAQKPLTNYEINLDLARQLATSDPKIVANVIKAWVSNE